jgi:hypothetical protein
MQNFEITIIKFPLAVPLEKMNLLEQTYNEQVLDLLYRKTDSKTPVLVYKDLQSGKKAELFVFVFIRF